MKKPPRHIIDAKFKVVEPEKRRWWQGWYIDWTVVLGAAALGLISALSHLAGRQ